MIENNEVNSLSGKLYDIPSIKNSHCNLTIKVPVAGIYKIIPVTQAGIYNVNGVEYELQAGDTLKIKLPEDFEIKVDKCELPET